MRTFDFTSRWGDKYEIAFAKTRYVSGNNLAVEVACREDGEEWWEPYGMLTVNIGWTFGERQAYLDTNNVPDLVEFVMSNGWAKEIGEGHSGFCTYPMVEFTEEFVNEVCVTEEE